MSYWWVIPIAAVLTYFGLRVSEKLVDRDVRKLKKEYGDEPKEYLRLAFERYADWQQVREGIEGESRGKKLRRVLFYFFAMLAIALMMFSEIDKHIAAKEYVSPQPDPHVEYNFKKTKPPESPPWWRYVLKAGWIVLVPIYESSKRSRGVFGKWCLKEVTGEASVEQLDALFSIDTEWHEKNASLMSDGDLVDDERTDTSANSDLTERSGEKL